jgi:hypothetical protein
LYKRIKVPYYILLFEHLNWMPKSQFRKVSNLQTPVLAMPNSALPIQFSSFIFLHKQVKIKCQHNDKNYIDGEKGHIELVSSSPKLIAGEIGKRCQFFRLLTELKPYTNNHKNITSHRRGTILGNGTRDMIWARKGGNSTEFMWLVRFYICSETYKIFSKNLKSISERLSVKYTNL